jgi:inorganic pyrophosphatase
MPKTSAFARLQTFDGEALNVVIETPQKSRNKFNFDEELGIFKLGGVLPAGAVFPFDFGFAPQTLGEDGDPLDVLVLMDEPAFAGCLVPSRLIGAIEAEQTEDKKTERNDRLIAVAENSRNHKDVTQLGQLSPNLLSEIEHFFKSYNEIKGKKFKVLGRADAATARKLIEAGMKKAGQKSTGKSTRRAKSAGKKRKGA